MADFESTYFAGESMIGISNRTEMEKLFLNHIRVDKFGENNTRNYPTNNDEVENLKRGMVETGLQSSLLTFTVVADEKTTNVIAQILSGSGRKQFEYGKFLTACESANFDWKSTLIDGHHRREAILLYLESLDLGEDIVIRVRWLLPTANPADYRR